MRMLSGYRVALLSSGIAEWKEATLTRLELSGLVATKVYTVKVTAINRIGKESSVSGSRGMAFETSVATPPSAPWGLALISSSGGAIELSWKPPAITGGVPLDDMIYNVTMLPLHSCYRPADTQDGERCSSCNTVRMPRSNEYEVDRNGLSICERPATSTCADGTSSCCVTRVDSEYGPGISCSNVDLREGRRRVVVGSNTTLFQALNHSTAYLFDVQANNLVGTSEHSPARSFSTTYVYAALRCQQKPALR